ncbi:NVEALA domain-containing protein [Bacteroides sp. ET71]|uniref:NVEALA domain-containing protein n=1 Tax=Bacteroides sp. ET71 TaxID=2939421 RepID=UPI00201265D6|nr:NVEALA domain-containing protein [Bacteroides sp. ET71]MCL1616068.1 NVEALA domain-containing protein [Bacteroides sp. ET71]
MKKIMRIAMVAVVAAVAGYGIYETQTGSAMSEFALANVEALAAGESGVSCTGPKDMNGICRCQNGMPCRDLLGCN